MLGSLFSVDSAIDAYLLVYDITSETSLENLEYFDELIEKNLDASGRGPGIIKPVKIVAGNKCDLSDHRVISSQQGLAWAKTHNCGFMETSAKAMVNVEETFQTLIKKVVSNREEVNNAKGSAGGGSGGGAGGVGGGSTGRYVGGGVNGVDEKANKKTGCCVIS